MEHQTAFNLLSSIITIPSCLSFVSTRWYIMKVQLKKLTIYNNEHGYE
jgi:hypothetical protein